MMRPAHWVEALGNTRNAAFVVDSSQRILTWNKGAEKLLGYSAAEVVNRHCYEVIAGCLRSGKLWCCPNCAVQRSTRRGHLLQDFDLLTSTKEGRSTWVNITVIGLPKKNNPLTVHLLRNLRRGQPEAASQAVPARWQDGPLAALTRRELEVLKLVAKGRSTAEVAERLCISRFTVRNHVRNIFAKLSVHSRTGALSLALRQHLV